jgi:uncharacterized protein (TIGR02147 family)
VESSIYEYESYPDYLKATVKNQISGSRGSLLKLANHAGVHTSTLSQILAGKKHFTSEQACLVADFLGLKELETRYFLLLVGKARAGTSLLRQKIQSEMEELRVREDRLVEIVPQDRPLSEEERAVFYSNWFYSAIWAQTSVPEFGNREALQKYFGLPRRLINNVVSFLLRTGLCEEKEGIIQPGHQYSHLEAESPLISRHHANWRIKAMERHPHLAPNELSYSSPMTISKKDAAKVRKLIAELVAKVNEIRGPSACEELHCLNIDWFNI